MVPFTPSYHTGPKQRPPLAMYSELRQRLSALRPVVLCVKDRGWLVAVQVLHPGHICAQVTQPAVAILFLPHDLNHHSAISESTVDCPAPGPRRSKMDAVYSLSRMLCGAAGQSGLQQRQGRHHSSPSGGLALWGAASSPESAQHWSGTPG